MVDSWDVWPLNSSPPSSFLPFSHPLFFFSSPFPLFFTSLSPHSSLFSSSSFPAELYGRYCPLPLIPSFPHPLLFSSTSFALSSSESPDMVLCNSPSTIAFMFVCNFTISMTVLCTCISLQRISHFLQSIFLVSAMSSPKFQMRICLLPIWIFVHLYLVFVFLTTQCISHFLRSIFLVVAARKCGG